MKLLTIQKVGYNKPKNANWCYEVYSINMIDTVTVYNYNIMVSSTFGGIQHLKGAIKMHEVSEVSPLPVITNVAKKQAGYIKIRACETDSVRDDLLAFLNN